MKMQFCPQNSLVQCVYSVLCGLNSVLRINYSLRHEAVNLVNGLFGYERHLKAV